MKKVFIDLELLDRLEREGDLDIQCSYPFHRYYPYDRWGMRPGNDGIAALRELATYAVVCRQCESANCVISCPRDALEKDADGILRRYSLRCIGCRSCTVACPFGTIYPQAIPFLASGCDYCLKRLKPGEEPLCVKTGPDGAVKYTEMEPDESKNIHKVGDHLVVKCEVWKR
ncbi:MAG: 4Fe-4S dicluster domain-containing protein [Candidatus Eisenbacteria bacterium]